MRAASVIAAVVALQAFGAQAQDRDCALYLEERRLCTGREGGSRCVYLEAEQSRHAMVFRCLMRDHARISGCLVIYVALNTYVSLAPLGVKYQMLLAPGRSRNEFYDEERIVRTCVRQATPQRNEQ